MSNGSYKIKPSAFYYDYYNISTYGIPKFKISFIKKVIFNPPATIVFWSDNTKTVVKAQDEKFDPEKGLAMAISKKAMGNKGHYYNHFKNLIDKYYE